MDTRAAGIQPAKQKELDALIDRINSRLNGINEGVRRVVEFRHRLMSPRPAAVADKPPSSAQSPTIDGRLRDVAEYADRIMSDLSEVCSDLDNAA